MARPKTDPPRLCSYPGCERRHACRDLCISHYRQLRRGHPLTPLEPSQTRPNGQTLAEAAEWILARVEPRMRPRRERRAGDPDTPCWEYGRVDTTGYVRVQCRGRTYSLAHVMLRHAEGLPYPTPADEPIAVHRCRNPRCARPDHLEWSTMSRRRLDTVRAGRHRTDCVPLDERKVRRIRKRLAKGHRQVDIAAAPRSQPELRIAGQDREVLDPCPVTQIYIERTTA